MVRPNYSIVYPLMKCHCLYRQVPHLRNLTASILAQGAPPFGSRVPDLGSNPQVDGNSELGGDEPSSLLTAVKNGWHGEIILEHSSKYESDSNGEVKRAGQEVQEHARTIRGSVQLKSGSRLEPNMPTMARIVERAANMYSLFHKGEPKDG